MYVCIYVRMNDSIVNQEELGRIRSLICILLCLRYHTIKEMHNSWDITIYCGLILCIAPTCFSTFYWSTLFPTLAKNFSYTNLYIKEEWHCADCCDFKIINQLLKYTKPWTPMHNILSIMLSLLVILYHLNLKFEMHLLIQDWWWFIKQREIPFKSL